MYKLTDVALKALKPRDREYFARDPKRVGFGVRVRPSGHMSFEYVYDFDGRRRRMVFGPYEPGNKDALSLEVAGKLYTAAAAKRAEGLDPSSFRREARVEGRRREREQEQRPTVDTLADDYLEFHAKEKKRSWREDERILNHDVLPAWKNRKAYEVTRADVNRLLDKIKARGAGVMANRTLALVRKLFNFAIARDMLNGQANPATLVERRAEEVKRQRKLTDAEIRALWSEDLSPMAASTVTALRLILATGQRPGEVLGMDRRELDGEWWTIPPAKTKNKHEHRVYLTQHARDLIACMPILGGSDLVFPGARDANRTATVAGLSRAVRDWQTARGVADEAARWTPHDLRRTCGTRMGSLSVSRFIQDRVLNHADRSIGATYDVHDYASEKRAALEKWARSLDAILDDAAPASKVVALRRART